jgi:glycosyltransferase involved in cell wall biosynthesis
MPDEQRDRVLNIVVDQRFKLAPDGRVWTHVPPSYESFEKALRVFDRVRVIGRAYPVNEPPSGSRLVSGSRVEVVPMPYYVGPLQYLRKRREVRRRIDEVARFDGAFLLRIPSQIGFLLGGELERLRRPYAVELLSDPYDLFSRGVAVSGIAPLFRPYFCRRTKELCGRASAVNYVTGSRTRANHPAPAAQWSDSLSDVEMTEEAFLTPRLRSEQGRLELVTVGLLDLLVKGQDVMIKALARCQAAGLDARLTFVGDGQYRDFLMRLARKFGVESRIRITGAVGGAAQVRQYLAESDVFLLPSRVEGIPRALLEAMAAGLPAICSRAGAMADLIETAWHVRAGDAANLASKILKMAAQRRQWVEIGRRNQALARDFESSVLGPRRVAFYEAILRTCLAGSPANAAISAAAEASTDVVVRRVGHA